MLFTMDTIDNEEKVVGTEAEKEKIVDLPEKEEDGSPIEPEDTQA